jgi:ATP-dependent DNA helicase RecQ
MMDTSQGSEEHKRAEQQRLNAMLGLCEITGCRRQALLGYFGEELAEPCGNCDTCLEPVDTWDGTEAARMALSAVYRTGQRFGVGHLVDVLRGVDSDKVRQFAHDNLPTFGVGSALDVNQWRSVFRQLVASAYLAVDLERYGALRLREKARPLLKGEETLPLRKDNHGRGAARRSPARTATALAADVDPALWEALRACRTELAKAQGVPPYMIFHDRTLQALCLEQPQDLEAFGAISGVGERKREAYGPAFLAVIAEHAGAGAAYSHK